MRRRRAANTPLFACLLVAGFCFAACCPAVEAAGLTRIDRTEPAQQTPSELPDRSHADTRPATPTAESRTLIAPQGRTAAHGAGQPQPTDALPEGLLEILPRLSAALEVVQHQSTTVGTEGPAPKEPVAKSHKPSPSTEARTVIRPRSRAQARETPDTKQRQHPAIVTVAPDAAAEIARPTIADTQAPVPRATIGPDHRTPPQAPPSEGPLLQLDGAAREHQQQIFTGETRPGPAEPDKNQPQQPAVSLTPATAAALALENSLDLQVAAARIREAEAQLRQAFGLDDFRLTASATYGRRGPISTFSVPGENGQTREVELGDPEIRQENLQLVKPLYTENRIEHTQKLAGQRLESQRLNRIAAKRAIDLSVRNATYQVLRAEQLAIVAQDRAKAMAAHLEDTKSFREVGLVPQFEVVQAETVLAEARGQVIAARTTFESAKAALRRLLNLDQTAEIELNEGKKPQLPEGSRTDLIKQAWQLRPEVRVARQGVKLAQLNVSLAADSDNLSVNLVGGLTHTKETFGSEPWSWQVALQAEKPIIDANEKETEVATAKAQLAAAKLEVEKLKQQIALEVTQAQLGVDDATQRLQVAQQGIVEARERLRIAKVRYENEVGPGIEVLDAQAALTAARAELVNARYGLRSAITELRSSMGLWKETD